MDKEPAFLENATMMIIGMGLMGGSLAMALKGKCARLVGIDRDYPTLQEALEKQVIDAGYPSLEESAMPVDAIILALPVNAILATLERLPVLYPGKAIVLDLGSTKHLIMQAMQKLPERFDPIGGHPMCRKENSGFAHAESGLFLGATFAFTRLSRSSKAVITFANELCTAIGAVPFWMDAEQHDRCVAVTSHLPFILSNSLAALTPLEAAPIAGPGYRSTARLAPSPAEMMQDILITNRKNILAELERFKTYLTDTTRLLAEENYHQLMHRFNTGKKQYLSILQNEKKE